MKRTILLIVAAICFVALGCKDDEPGKDNKPVPPKETYYRNCVSDIHDWYYVPESELRERFNFYKMTGVNILRVELSWRNLEKQEGVWDENEGIFDYLRIAKEYGFRTKIILGVIMDPPQWFFDKYPASKFIDQNGRTTPNCFSFWYPDLKNVITEKSDKMVAMLKSKNLWDNVDFIIPALGSAGEPIYPPLWTLPAGFTSQTFWCYDDNAQLSFREYAKSKYITVDDANQTWSTTFASWDEVEVLQPGTKPGPYWNDVLTWYRDFKRSYIEWQTQQAQSYVAGTSKKLLVYIPGVEYTESGWNSAVQTGRGNDDIMVMADSKFLVDLAAGKNYMLQYTGMNNENEVKKLRQYMDSKAYTTEMWGENVGNAGGASDPEDLARIIVENKLFGLDYTHGKYMFEEGTLIPNENMESLKKAYKTIQDYWAKGK